MPFQAKTKEEFEALPLDEQDEYLLNLAIARRVNAAHKQLHPNVAVPFPEAEPPSDGVALEARGWQAWLTTLAPTSFTSPFAPEHIEFWDLYWAILHRQKRGEIISAKERALLLPFGRGMAKSTNAEMAAIAEGCILGEGYVLYLSDSQLLAEEHLYSVKAILENGIFAKYYPEMASPELQSSIHSKSKYTQDTIVTNNGKWGMTARGLTANVRGGRLATQRFTLVINDDIDNLTDSLMVIEKKKRIISRTVFPAMSKSGKTILAQNLITPNSVASQILSRKTDILSERTVIGGGKAVKAFKDLELEQVFELDGTPRWTIKNAQPTWDYFNLEDARSFLALSGKEAFLAEYQHEFDEKQGRVIPTYNEDAQLITWDMFEKVYGQRFIGRNWRSACGLDVGFSDGMHPHYSYWAFITVSPMNSVLPGKQFVYRGRAFTSTSIDDQALEIWRELRQDGDYQADVREFPALQQHFPIPESIEKIQRGGMVNHWQMSHENTGVMMTLHRYGLPFIKTKYYQADSGVAQWNHLSRCDYSKPNPFKGDELLDDGTYLIGSPTLYYIVDDDQYIQPRDERGLKLLREQVSEWEWVKVKILETGLTQEKPSKINDDSCDVVKGLLEYFGQNPVPLTIVEKHEVELQRMGLDDASIEKAEDPLPLIQMRMIEKEAFRKKQRQSQGIVNPFRR